MFHVKHLAVGEKQMTLDLMPFFEQYKAIANLSQSTFDRVAASHADCVRCDVGCDDCCHALFDLTLVEALYINDKFSRMFGEEDRSRLIEKANRADRQTYRIKKVAYRQSKAGEDEARILPGIAAERVRCPLLSDAHRCELYAHRPITCRLYGIPTAIDGVGHTCGKSGFSKGQSYPTANLDPIHRRLRGISSDLALSMESKYAAIGESLVPLSMALLTTYDDAYLGIDEGPGGRP